jgi:hypothetical protein
MAIVTTSANARVSLALSVAAFAAITFSMPSKTVAQSPSPAPSSVATPAENGPIAITSCEVIRLNNGYGMGNVTLNVGHANYFFKVSFVDQSSVAADSVGFEFDNNADRVFITDAGSYGPAMTITHTLRSSSKTAQTSPRPGGTGPLACAVVSA